MAKCGSPIGRFKVLAPDHDFLSTGRTQPKLRDPRPCAVKLPATYLSPPTRSRHYRPWYTRPLIYLPAAFLIVLIGGMIIYWSLLARDLRAEAATFDLSKLEQMESASVILDRNDKIFGQIYVENRETVPYEQLPRDLINAVVAVEDS